MILYNLRCAVSSRSFQDCKASLPKEGPDAEAGSTYSSFKVCLPRSCFSCLHSVDFSRGFYGIVMALIGDLDYMNKFLGLPHWASAANPCNLCLCTKAGPLTWKDSRPNAPWRATTYTTGSWQANPDRSKNTIFDAANISGLSCQSDCMHVKYPGYQQFFLGSVLWLLAHEILLGEPLANIRAIGLYVFRCQRRNSIPSKFPLTAWRKLSIFERQKGFPKLRGKGAHVRHVAKALRALWNRKMSQANRNHRRVA